MSEYITSIDIHRSEERPETSVELGLSWCMHGLAYVYGA